jgi:ATP-dependent Clp protease ATP-binding subunit ClpA
VFDIQSSDSKEVTGAKALVSMFAEKESPAVWLLGEQNMTQRDAVNFMVWSMAPSRRAERR